MSKWDVKLVRPNVQSIICGPYDTPEEAQMHATRLSLQHNQEQEQKLAEFNAEPFDPTAYDDKDELREAKLDYENEKNALHRWLKDTRTTFEVVKHKRGRV